MSSDAASYLSLPPRPAAAASPSRLLGVVALTLAGAAGAAFVLLQSGGLRDTSLSSQAAAVSDAEAFRVHNLPDLPHEARSLKQYAGFLPTALDKPDWNSYLFFWLVEAEEEAKSSEPTPLLIWLNGGPGASSLTGLLLENGPFGFRLGDSKLSYNPHGWTKVAHMAAIEERPWSPTSLVSDT